MRARLLGRRQVVRHRFLVPAFAGSSRSEEETTARSAVSSSGKTDASGGTVKAAARIALLKCTGGHDDAPHWAVLCRVHMHVLILGGDGYLGWPTAMRFSAGGHEVSSWLVMPNRVTLD